MSLENNASKKPELILTPQERSDLIQKLMNAMKDIGEGRMPTFTDEEWLSCLKVAKTILRDPNIDLDFFQQFPIHSIEEFSRLYRLALEVAPARVVVQLLKKTKIAVTRTFEGE